MLLSNSDFISSAGQHLGASRFILVGGGIASLIIAKYLERYGVGSVILEGGDSRYTEQSQNLYDGEIVNSGLDYFPLRDARLRFLGGSTNHWGRHCLKFSPSDFSSWPFSYAELYQHEEFVSSILGVDIPDAGKLISESCLRYETPVADFDGVTSYQADVVGSDKIIVVTDSSLIDVETENENVITLSIVNSSDDVTRLKCKDHVVVLGCGGLENVRLLLNFVDKLSMPRTSAVLGSGFMEHPTATFGYLAGNLEAVSDFLGIETLDSDKYFIRPTDQYLQNTKSVNMGMGIYNLPSDVDSVKSFIKALACSNQVTNSLFEALRGDGRCLTFLRGSVEQRSYSSSFLQLSDDVDRHGLKKLRLKWQIEVDSFLGVSNWFKQLNSENVSRQLGTRILEASPSNDAIVGNFHHMGGTAIESQIGLGVANKWGRYHGLKNFFVTGSSCFPTSSFVNPTYTLGCYSAIQAEYFRKAFV